MRVTAAGFVGLAFAALGGCQSGPKPLTAADRAMASTMDSSFAAAATAGNVDGMMASYAPDAMVMPPETPMAHGTEQIRGLWSGMMGAMKVSLTLTQETADGAGDFMYTSGKYHLVPQPEGSAPAVDGKYLEVFHRGADGKWMVVADSWNPDTPPPAPAPAPQAARHRAR
jgi:ketosteroid isomerase-like protein